MRKVPQANARSLVSSLSLLSAKGGCAVVFHSPAKVGFNDSGIHRSTKKVARIKPKLDHETKRMDNINGPQPSCKWDRSGCDSASVSDHRPKIHCKRVPHPKKDVPPPPPMTYYRPPPPPPAWELFPPAPPSPGWRYPTDQS